jgi:hypothetical protein
LPIPPTGDVTELPAAPAAPAAPPALAAPPAGADVVAPAPPPRMRTFNVPYPDLLEPPEAPEPPLPPWHFWFESGNEGFARDLAPAPDPEQGIQAVREAITAGLESYRGRVPALGSDEFVAVAVEFVPDGLLTARPARTLVVRVRARDLRDRQAGRLSAPDFRARLEFEES